jgi:transcriptional regulator with XRE-family HTH domain
VSAGGAVAIRAFGHALLEFLEASRHRNQRQFALAIGMEPTYLNRIVKGLVQRPDPETLQKMATALGKPYGELLDLAGYPPLGNGNGDRSAYRARLAALDAEEAALPLPLPLGEVLIAEVAEAQREWPRLTTAARNAILKVVLARVVLTGRDVAIEPSPDLARLLAGVGERVAALG